MEKTRAHARVREVFINNSYGARRGEDGRGVGDGAAPPAPAHQFNLLQFYHVFSPTDSCLLKYEPNNNKHSSVRVR